MSPYSGSIKLAGQRRWQPVSANFIGVWSLKTHWEVYEAAAKEHGHEVDREIWRVARSIHVGGSDQEAEDFVKARAPWRKPARPFCSKRPTQYSTDRGASPSSLATCGQVIPWATSSTPWRRWS